MIDHFDESTTMGTRAMSGSAAIKFKNLTIAASESSKPSSMFTSIICAPFSTCCRATLKASSYWPFKISLANFGRAGDVGPRADVDEVGVGPQRQRLEAAQPQIRFDLRNHARLTIFARRRDRADVLRRRAAAPADEVEPALPRPIAQLRR